MHIHSIQKVNSDETQSEMKSKACGENHMCAANDTFPTTTLFFFINFHLK